MYLFEVTRLTVDSCIEIASAINIRAMAVVQLLLGNIGVAGGGMNAPAYGLDPTFSEQQYVGEIEERHQLWGQPGKLKVTGYLSWGQAGSFPPSSCASESASTLCLPTKVAVDLSDDL